MTRKQMTEAAEVLKAAAEGKRIQCRTSDNAAWISLYGKPEHLGFDFTRYEYRIEPERKYEPYRSMKDFVDFGYALKTDRTVILRNHDDARGTIVQISVGCVDIRFFDEGKNDTEILEFSYSQLLDECMWNHDGTPCGVLVEG